MVTINHAIFTLATNKCPATYVHFRLQQKMAHGRHRMPGHGAFLFTIATQKNNYACDFSRYCRHNSTLQTFKIIN